MRLSEEQIQAGRAFGEALVRFLAKMSDLVPAGRQLPNDPLSPSTTLAARSKSPALPEKLLIDNREAARLLGVSPRKLWDLSAPRGPIPVVQLGRLVRYSRESLLQLIADQTITGIQGEPEHDA